MNVYRETKSVIVSYVMHFAVDLLIATIVTHTSTRMRIGENHYDDYNTDSRNDGLNWRYTNVVGSV